MENDFIDITKLNQIHVGSYMTKEKFVEMMNNLNYVAIDSANIHFITGFEYDAKENITRPRGFDINIM